MQLISKREAAQVLWAKAQRLKELAVVLSTLCRDHKRAEALLARAEALNRRASALHWS